MIVDNLDVDRFTIDPLKADAILPVDSNAVLACPITLQGFKAVTWHTSKRIQTQGVAEDEEPTVRLVFESGKSRNPVSGCKSVRTFVGKPGRHSGLAHLDYTLCASQIFLQNQLAQEERIFTLPLHRTSQHAANEEAA